MSTVSRFKVVAQPPQRPGCCFITKRSGEANGPYIDTGINLQREGQIYICADIVRELYALIEPTLPVEPEPVVPEITRDEIRDELSSVLEALNVLVDAVTSSEPVPAEPVPSSPASKKSAVRDEEPGDLGGELGELLSDSGKDVASGSL